jgi:hypothetical protein
VSVAYSNIVAKDGDDDIVIVNLRETEEGRTAMAAEPEVQHARTSAAFPAPEEPLFLAFDAAVSFHPAMTPDDLAKAGLEELGKSYA